MTNDKALKIEGLVKIEGVYIGFCDRANVNEIGDLISCIVDSPIVSHTVINPVIWDLHAQIKNSLAHKIEELEKEIRGLEERNGELEAELEPPSNNLRRHRSRKHEV